MVEFLRRGWERQGFDVPANLNRPRENRIALIQLETPGNLKSLKDARGFRPVVQPCQTFRTFEGIRRAVPPDRSRLLHGQKKGDKNDGNSDPLRCSDSERHLIPVDLLK